jgi:hypothetical protein
MRIIVDPKRGASDPRTPEEYVGMVEQALFEIGDTRASIEYDMEGIQPAIFEFIDDLERELRHLRASMADGSYQFGHQDLPFMRMIEHLDVSVLPFKRLLEDINRIHHNGLTVD